MLKLILLVATVVFGCAATPSFAVDTNAMLTAWINAQTNLQTWSADFKQTRALKALTQPLIATGKVWFAAPNQFRWELGQPAQTLAVRQPEQMLVIYPKLKRVERYSLDAAASGPWKDALALLEAGFPRTRAELEARFNIIELALRGDVGQVTLQPKNATARRMMPQIRIDFAMGDYALRGTELTFADGSTMRNDFTNSELNPKLDALVFQPKLEADYKVVEPMKAK